MVNISIAFEFKFFWTLEAVDGKELSGVVVAKIIKSISINNNNDLNKIYRYHSVDYFLFDYKPLKSELPGGNSKSFNWDLLNNLKTTKPWFLSGGINIDNIETGVDKICRQIALKNNSSASSNLSRSILMEPK